MEWVLLIWLHIQGFPADIGPYESEAMCLAAKDAAKQQLYNSGFFLCMPRPKRDG